MGYPFVAKGGRIRVDALGRDLDAIVDCECCRLVTQVVLGRFISGLSTVERPNISHARLRVSHPRTYCGSSSPAGWGSSRPDRTTPDQKILDSVSIWCHALSRPLSYGRSLPGTLALLLRELTIEHRSRPSRYPATDHPLSRVILFSGNITQNHARRLCLMLVGIRE